MSELTGFFGGPAGGTSMTIPSDRQDCLVPIPAPVPTLIGYGYGCPADFTVPTACYIRQRYWWPLGMDWLDRPQRWEGSCMVHEDMRPTGVALGLALIAWLTGYAYIEPITARMGQIRWPEGAQYDINRNTRPIAAA